MENKIVDVLKKENKPMKAGEIAVAAGIEKTDVDKAIKQLVKEEKLYSPKRCYYDIKK